MDIYILWRSAPICDTFLKQDKQTPARGTLQGNNEQKQIMKRVWERFSAASPQKVHHRGQNPVLEYEKRSLNTEMEKVWESVIKTSREHITRLRIAQTSDPEAGPQDNV